MSAAFNPLALLAERTCGPVYNAIDTGNNLLAVRHADKILQSQPDLVLASALKALALVRLGKRDEAATICTKLVTRGLRNGEQGTLAPLTWTLERLGRRTDEIALLEGALKNSPNDEELSRQTFMALIKCNAFQKAQQISLKMHKSFSARKQNKGRFADEYFWWSILSYLLLARDPAAPGAALALPLSQRMIEKQIETKPLGLNDEEALCLLLEVLVRQGKNKDAFDLVAKQGSVGDTLCDRNLSLEFTRTDLAKRLQDWQYVEKSCWARIEAGSRNWAHFTGYLDAAEKLGKDAVLEAQKKVVSLMGKEGALKDRSIRLAELEVLKKLSDLGDAEVDTELLSKVTSYFDQFASKACCHEDLLPYLGVLSSTSRSTLINKLRPQSRPMPIQTEADLRINMSIAKITRTIQSADTLSEASETSLASSLFKQYLDALSVGSSLPDTEMQPADDLALLGAQALLSAYSLSGGKLDLLYQTIAVLEFALCKSPKGYQLRMLLIRSYILAGAFDRAAIHHGLLGLKSVQADTLSHLVCDRCSAFSATCTDDGLYKLSVRTLSTAQAIYDENANSTPEMIAKALEHGIYSRVGEFVEFGEALERSLQRQVVRLEEARAHLHNRQNFKDQEKRSEWQAGITRTVEAVRGDLVKGTHDQRDFTVLVNYQPLGSRSVEELCQVGPRVNAGWAKCITFTLDSDAQKGQETGFSEEDTQQLTEQEKKLVALVKGSRAGKVDSALLVDMLESAKKAARALVDGTATQAGHVRPVDIVHEAGLALEGIYHTGGSLTDEAKATAKTHLAEIATLVNHLCRPSQADVDAEVLYDGLAGLDKAQVDQMIKSARDNVARSWSKVFANLRDALRDGL